MLDIHSHILPDVDDGAKNLDASVKLLTMMKEQGITHVIATPHFYAETDNYEEFQNKVRSAFSSLSSALEGKNFPKIYLGCEMFYYRYIGNSESVQDFCLNKSSYLLLELADNCIDNTLLTDIRNLRNNLGVTPIIAHLERYYRAPGYKKLLSFIEENQILVQINASSFFNLSYKHAVFRLLKKGLVTFIATDSHSPSSRPPMMKAAIDIIDKKFGKEYSAMLVQNSLDFLDKITTANNTEL